MANYFVSTTRGSDSTGTGTATNPWKTITKAAGPSPAITLSGTGDTLYIEPGIYRECVGLVLAPATSGGRLSIVGDVTGAGFLAGGYATPATGTVDWRAWSDDVTPLTSSNLYVPSGSRNFVTVRGIKFTGGKVASNQSCVNINGSNGWTIQDCQFVCFPTGAALFVGASSAGALDLIFERCVVVSDYRALNFSLPLSASEYALNVVVRNCLFVGCAAVFATTTGTGAGLPTGVTVQNCTVVAGRILTLGYANTSMTTPLGVYGCVGVGAQSNLISAANTSQVVEDGNILLAATPRSNVNVGANSNTQICPSLDFLDGFLTGQPLRPFGEPTVGSSLLAFGNYGPTNAVDLFNQARPATASAGALERETLPGGGGGGGGGGTTLVNGGLAMGYQGDFGVGQKVAADFNTSAALTSGAAAVYRDGGAAKSTAGVTLAVGLDSITGLNSVVVDTTADPNFYKDNHEYVVVLTAGTVGGTSVAGTPVCSFSIRNRPLSVKSVAFDTSASRGAGG